MATIIIIPNDKVQDFTVQIGCSKLEPLYREDIGYYVGDSVLQDPVFSELHAELSTFKKQEYIQSLLEEEIKEAEIEK